jgi:hypothetical protein
MRDLHVERLAQRRCIKVQREREEEEETLKF